MAINMPIVCSIIFYSSSFIFNSKYPTDSFGTLLHSAYMVMTSFDMISSMVAFAISDRVKGVE